MYAKYNLTSLQGHNGSDTDDETEEEAKGCMLTGHNGSNTNDETEEAKGCMLTG